MSDPKRRLDVEVIPVTPLRQNCSLVWDGETRHALVIDPGGDEDVILERVAAHDLTVEAILLTHGHLDHAGGAHALRDALTKRQGAPVPVIGPDRRDEFLLSSIEENAARFGLSGMISVAPDRYTQDGDVLPLLGRSYEVLHVPGHTPGHVVFFEPQDRVLFAGDTLFRGTIGRTDFPYGDGPTLVQGVRTKILPLGDDVLVLPGHGAPTTVRAERAENPFLQ
ncbi:MBL fold metallo-hydrolase [Acetobacter sp. DsW_063]|uniref:MBL fold metallo-hydrolase n=1 Tax=Acetobacter sp. DsW_063 TaxID=1514894 RepID=UPI000A39F3E2|nr:MBL fold metallo-hydrolase [Acetobacter sp. DsW_063]OUJ14600.1 hypothetical protein HK28_12810 [Acetobacter sp. DsW_063]